MLNNVMSKFPFDNAKVALFPESTKCLTVFNPLSYYKKICPILLQMR